GVINRRKPADLNTVGQRRRGLILSIAVVVGNRHARFNLGGVAEKIFRRLAFAGDIIVITGAASVRVGGTTPSVHGPNRARLDVARAMGTLPEEVGHR